MSAIFCQFSVTSLLERILDQLAGHIRVIDLSQLGDCILG